MELMDLGRWECWRGDRQGKERYKRWANVVWHTQRSSLFGGSSLGFHFSASVQYESVWLHTHTFFFFIYLFISHTISKRHFSECKKINSCLAFCSQAEYNFKGHIMSNKKVWLTSLVPSLAFLISQPGRIVKRKWSSTRRAGSRPSLYYEVQRYENTWDTVWRRALQTQSEKGRARMDGSKGSRFEAVMHYSLR